MRIAVVQFPGSNCERETILAIKRAEMTPIPFLWNEDPAALRAMDGYVIVGGFSYEDRSRAGIIAALDPVMQCIKEESVCGKPVLGICNGAQILVETGMVPGFEGYPLRAALTNNKRIQNGQVLGTGFYNSWCHLVTPAHSRRNAFTRYLQHSQCLNIPLAHAEGRFVMPPSILEQVLQEGLIALQYCNEHGTVIDEFPINPNGSVCNIAALCNPAGNVMAIMPHPERTPEGDSIFASMRDYITEGCPTDKRTLSSAAVPTVRQAYQPQNDISEMHVALIINDNQAFTVENTLRHLGEPVRITRYTHWEVQCESKSTLHQIQASGVLFNAQKEYLVATVKKPGQRTLLIRSKDDCLGLQKKQQLEHHFNIKGIQSLRHGVLWQIQTNSEQLDAVVQRIIDSHILYNPLSHECYEYE